MRYIKAEEEEEKNPPPGSPSAESRLAVYPTFFKAIVNSFKCTQEQQN